MTWKLLLKTFIPVSRIFDNEDDILIFSRNDRKSSASEKLFFLIIFNGVRFSNIPGKHENVVFIIKNPRKTNVFKSNYQIIKNEKNIYFLRSELNVSTFWICMDATFFEMSSFNNFLLIVVTDRNKISSHQKCLFFPVSLYPVYFFVNSPFK